MFHVTTFTHQILRAQTQNNCSYTPTALVGLALLKLILSQSHSFRHTALSRTPPDEGSAPHSDLYLTTRNNRNSQTTMSPAGFELAVPTIHQPHTLALDSSAVGIGREL